MQGFVPIHPDNKARYPKEWPAISKRIRFERAEGRCECHGECGHDHDGRCDAKHGQSHPITGSKVVLTTAHLNHTPEDCLAMIDVIPHGNRWAWRFICAAGRVLAYSLESFPCDKSAFADAKAYRTAHWAHASTVDHRMGACI